MFLWVFKKEKKKKEEKKEKKEDVKISFSARDILFIIERIFRNFESVKHTKKASIFKKPKWIDSVKSCPVWEICWYILKREFFKQK